MSASAVIVGSKRTNAAPDTAAAAAASSSSRRAPAPPRRADPPSLFSAKSPDPLSLILSFALIDLPAALGRPYFPKELVRLVHEYAADACFVVQLESYEYDGLEIMHSSSCSSSTELLRWLGAHLPGELRANSVTDGDGDVISTRIEEPEFQSYCDCCLMDEELRLEGHAQISLLLHAQLRSNEYRTCYYEVEPNEDGEFLDPAKFRHDEIDLADHERFCSDAIRKRDAAIQARGQKPKSVRLGRLLERVRSSLLAGRLPRGMSPRPCDWAPLFEWIQDFEENLNEIGLGDWDWLPHDHPVLSAVIVRSTTAGCPMSIQGEARLWSSGGAPRLTKPAASMMIDEEDDDDGCEAQSEVRSSGSSSSASSASAPRVSSLSTDEESAARAAPRQRRN